MAELNEFEKVLAAAEAKAEKKPETKTEELHVPTVVLEESGISWGKIALLGLVVVLILGGMGGFVYWRNWTWRWEKIPMSDAMARVPTDWPVEKLAARLHETGKVRDAEAFLQAARELKLQTVKAGRLYAAQRSRAARIGGTFCA